MIPADRYYTKDHEWVKLDGTAAIVGITDHAQQALGDVTFVELPAVGKRVGAGESVAVIESVKAASDVFSPLAGTVAAVNTALSTTPEKVNEAPYDEGWICRLKDCDLEGLKNLMNAEQYGRYLQES